MRLYPLKNYHERKLTTSHRLKNAFLKDRLGLKSQLRLKIRVYGI